MDLQTWKYTCTVYTLQQTFKFDLNLFVKSYKNSDLQVYVTFLAQTTAYFPYCYNKCTKDLLWIHVKVFHFLLRISGLLLLFHCGRGIRVYRSDGCGSVCLCNRSDVA